MRTAQLVAESLRLRIGDRQLLDEVSLMVAAGEIVAVTGPSGSGKTSLLLVLAGVLEPDSGSVAIGLVGGGAATPSVGLVPQTLALAPTLTAAENVALLLQVAALDATEIRERVASSLSDVGLDTVGDRIVTDLSGGQRQRVAVARALALAPDVLVADEPTAELDGENQAIVMDLIVREAARGAAVVLATHDSVIVERCTRAFSLESGRLDLLASTGV